MPTVFDTAVKATTYGVVASASMQGVRNGLVAAMNVSRATYAGRLAAAGLTDDQAAYIQALHRLTSRGLYDEQAALDYLTNRGLTQQQAARVEAGFAPEEVWLPSRSYGNLYIDENGNTGRCLAPPSGVVVASDPSRGGAYLGVNQDLGGIGSLTLFHFGVAGASSYNVGVERCELDGTLQINSPNNAQNHILKVTAQGTLTDTVGLVFKDLVIRDPATAGLWLGADLPHYVRFTLGEDIYFFDGRQNHITLQRGNDSHVFRRIVSKNPTDQTIDFEHSEMFEHHSLDCRFYNIVGSKFGNPDSTILALSGEGTSQVVRAKFYDCTFYGVTRIVRSVRDAQFHNCNLLASNVSSIRAKVQIERDCYDVLFNACRIERGALEGVNPVILCQRNDGLVPQRITFRGCQITQYANDSIIFCEPVQDLLIEPKYEGTTLVAPSIMRYRGTATDTEYGLWIRAVEFDASATVRETTISGASSGVGRLRARFALFPHTVGNVGVINVSDCPDHVDPLTGQYTAQFYAMPGGARADWNAYPAMMGMNPSRVDWNSSSTPVPVIIAGSRNDVMTFAFRGASPEGIIVAPVGSYCYRVDTGELYRKNTGTDATGWALHNQDA